MLEIVSPLTGERLIIAANDFENKMDWFQAKRACDELGNGWRLPSLNELLNILKEGQKNGKGNFKKGYYWSNTEHGSDSDHVSLVCFGETIEQTILPKSIPEVKIYHYVRAVKAV